MGGQSSRFRFQVAVRGLAACGLRSVVLRPPTFRRKGYDVERGAVLGGVSGPRTRLLGDPQATERASFSKVATSCR